MQPKLKTLKKNKYINIVPYDENRVKLSVINNDPLTDYINASHIKCYNGKVVIASHGPQATTRDDFWRMIWEYDVATIVMLTQSVEAGKQKCTEYWPDVHCSEKCGDITVTSTGQKRYANYRTTQLKVVKGQEDPKMVAHCQFLAWPDNGAPKYALQLLKFRQMVLKVTAKNKTSVIHCSAGVGRTGCYIAIDNLLRELKASPGPVNVQAALEDLRNQRMNCIQTLVQYNFIYTAVWEAHIAGKTAIPTPNFIVKYSSIVAGIDREYQALEKLEKTYLTDEEKTELSLPVNKGKNRDENILTATRDRVAILKPEPGRNSYINAVFTASYYSRNAYIQTQVPLPDTAVDFWCMVLDYKCQLIVYMDESHGQDSSIFLPTLKEPKVFGRYTVKLLSENQISEGSWIELLISSTKADESLYANTGGAVGGEPGSYVNIIRVKSMKDATFSNATIMPVHTEMKLKVGNTQDPTVPVVVVCRNGCTYSSLFIVAANLLDMINDQQEVDVFQVVHDIRTTRPQAIHSMALYEQLYSLAHLRVGEKESSAVYINDGPSQEGPIYINASDVISVEV